MGAPLRDAVVSHHQDLIGILDGGQPVGDGDSSTVVGQGVQTLLDPAFALVVQGAGGLVQDQDGRVL